MEVWKDIKGYEGYYQISNTGLVRSLDRIVKSSLNSGYAKRKGKLKAFKVDKDGYRYVTLCKENNKKNYKIHRLVAESFIDNPKNLPTINHIDENKKNNLVENLEWCTILYNNVYGNRINNCKITYLNNYKNRINSCTCLRCGKVFESVNRKSKYCSSKCRTNFYRHGKMEKVC